MKFLVTKSSVYDMTRPCVESHKETYTTIDMRLKFFFDVTRPDLKEEWYKKGTNHREKGEFFVRDIQDEGWFIEFKDLKELTDFVDKYHPCVIDHPYGEPDIWQIEIYDYYRE